MAALMQKMACAPCLAARPALPLRTAASVRCAKVTARAQSGQKEAGLEIGRSAALASVAATWMMAGNANAAVELSQLAAADNRPAILATLFVPALGWVAFNMFQPVLSQLSRMDELANGDNPTTVGKNVKKAKKAISGKFAASVGLGAAASLLLADSANAASEVAQLAAADNRPAILATLFVPALGWVAFNIFSPLFNQLDRMNELASNSNPTAVGKSVNKAKKAVSRLATRSVATAIGLGAAGSLVMADSANAASEVAQLAAADNRPIILAALFVPALGWVAFNIFSPLFNQLDRMNELASNSNPTAVGKSVNKAKKAVKNLGKK